jgi:hypothetical protein
MSDRDGLVACRGTKGPRGAQNRTEEPDRCRFGGWRVECLAMMFRTPDHRITAPVLRWHILNMLTADLMLRIPGPNPTLRLTQHDDPTQHDWLNHDGPNSLHHCCCCKC